MPCSETKHIRLGVDSASIRSRKLGGSFETTSIHHDGGKD